MVNFRESAPDVFHLLKKEGREQRHEEFIKKLEPLAEFSNVSLETMINDNDLFGVEYEVHVNQGRLHGFTIVDRCRETLNLIKNFPEFLEKPSQEITSDRNIPDSIVRLRAIKSFSYRLYSKRTKFPEEGEKDFMTNAERFHVRCQNKLDYLKRCSKGQNDCHRLQSYHQWTDQDFARLHDEFEPIYKKTKDQIIKNLK